jgi:transposase
MKVDWPDDFEALYKQRGQQKYGLRLFALWKIQSGVTETVVCELISKTHSTIRKWRQLYEEKGLEELLKIRKGRGRKPRIKTSSQIDLALEAWNKKTKGGRIRVQDLVDYFSNEKGICYSVSGFYHVLHRLGYSWITSRSRHPKQNQETIDAFKKTSKH